MKSLFAKTNGAEVPVVEKSQTEAAKESGITTEQQFSDDSSEKISQDAQPGVQKIEATTTVWSVNHLVIVYILIWTIYFIDALQQSVGWALNPFVTSAFREHSLTATTSIVASLVGGLTKLPLAKVLDIWGRPQGFAICVFLLTVGLVMMASCQNVTTYAAAQVFYAIGNNGVGYTLSVVVADTSALKNRGLMYAFVSSPYIATTWAGGPLAQAILKGPGFRWGFGIFAIITPIVTMPLFSIFIWDYHKAKKAGLIPVRESNRTIAQSLKYYAIEFDLVGILLLAGGLALFLLPFSLYFKQADGWKSPLIICMIIFGGLLLIGFALYEKLVAPKTFIPFELLMDRTVIGACVLGSVLFIEFYIWDSYFTSFLQVVNNLSVTQSSYIANIYSIGSCLWAIVIGVAIKYTGRYKPFALYFGVPLTILGVGLMIAFRQPDVNIGYIIMCQIFIAFSGGTLVICEEIAAMAATSHQYIAVILAVLSMFASVGGAIGSTVAGAIWQGVFPVRLAKYLPEESLENFGLIYGDLVTQLKYPVGSPTRDAIVRAYGDAQRYMLISATCVLILAVVCVAAWRDINVKNNKQVKGIVV